MQQQNLNWELRMARVSDAEKLKSELKAVKSEGYTVEFYLTEQLIIARRQLKKLSK
jgi:hypothetical protein